MNPVSGSTAGWQQGISAWAPTLLWVGVVFAIGSSRALPMQDGAVLRLMIRKSIHIDAAGAGTGPSFLLSFWTSDPLNPPWSSKEGTLPSTSSSARGAGDDEGQPPAP